MPRVVLVVAVVVVVAPALLSDRTKTDQSGDESGSIAPVSKIMQL